MEKEELLANCTNEYDRKLMIEDMKKTDKVILRFQILFFLGILMFVIGWFLSSFQLMITFVVGGFSLFIGVFFYVLRSCELL